METLEEKKKKRPKHELQLLLSNGHSLKRYILYKHSLE